MDTLTLPKPTKRKKQKPKREPKYHVVLWNDDYNTMYRVVEILTRVLGISVEQANQYMLEAHTMGQTIIFTGSLTQAEMIKDKIIGHAPDPYTWATCEPTRLIASLQKASD